STGRPTRRSMPSDDRESGIRNLESPHRPQAPRTREEFRQLSVILGVVLRNIAWAGGIALRRVRSGRRAWATARLLPWLMIATACAPHGPGGAPAPAAGLGPGR